MRGTENISDVYQSKTKKKRSDAADSYAASDNIIIQLEDWNLFFCFSHHSVECNLRAARLG